MGVQWCICCNASREALCVPRWIARTHLLNILQQQPTSYENILPKQNSWRCSTYSDRTQPYCRYAVQIKVLQIRWQQKDQSRSSYTSSHETPSTPCFLPLHIILIYGALLLTLLTVDFTYNIHHIMKNLGHVLKQAKTLSNKLQRAERLKLRTRHINSITSLLILNAQMKHNIFFIQLLLYTYTKDLVVC